MTNDRRLADALGLDGAAELHARLVVAFASPDEARNLAEAIVRHTWGHPEDNELLWYVDDLFQEEADRTAAAGEDPPSGLAAWDERVAPLRDT